MSQQAETGPAIVGAKWMLAALLFGATISLTLLGLAFIPGETNFEAAATLGTKTTALFQKVSGYPIHCSDSRDASQCIDGMKARGAERAALWLGNSQVHEVNQWKEGETAGATVLFEALKRKGLDLLTFSMGNANLQEHYVMFEYLRQRMPLQVLILPVVFDDLREEGLRKGVDDFAHDEPTAALLATTQIGRRLAQANRPADIVDTAETTSGISNTLQEQAEKSITGWLTEHSRLWQSRPEVRGWLFIGLYRLRNFVFGITPNTKRKVIPGRYRDNMAALKAIIDSAQKSNVRIVMYVAPLRGDVAIPYDESEYASFKAEVGALANRPGIILEDLEKLVPGEYWGTKESTTLGEKQELDFMHFQAAGHRLLANKLDDLVTKATSADRRRR